MATTSVSPNSSLPRTNFRGIRPEEAASVPIDIESLPQRLPLFFTFAPWGETDKARMVSGSTLSRFFGDNVLNPLGAYYSHQSYFIGEQFRGAGQALIQRLDLPDAKQASSRLSIDVVLDDIPQYERNADGSFRRDSVTGEKIPTGTSLPGIRIQHRQIEIPVDTVTGESTFGRGSEEQGTMTSAASGDVSRLIPYLDTLARFKGKRGDNEGFRLSAPTRTSRIAADDELNERLGAFVYRIQCIQRASSNARPTVQQTLLGSQQRDFTFTADAIDDETGTIYDAQRAILESYETDNPEQFLRYGVFEDIHVYSELLSSVLAEMAALETAHTGTEISGDQINFLTGTDVNGVPYYTIVVEGPTQGGLVMGDTTNLYFKGGADGEMSDEIFNELVTDIVTNLENSEVPYHDIAALPYDSVWDSGFPIETKRLFANFHNLRPDVHVHACTQDVLLPTNTPEQDTSVMILLRSHYRSMLESEEFGTGAVRFTVCGNAGIRIGDAYRKQTPYLAYLCYLGALYMGAGDGAMVARNSFGKGSDNVLPAYRKHNAFTKSWIGMQTDWDNGMNFAQTYDMNRQSWMGLRSMYEDMNSVLSTYINVCIACNLTRIGHIVWRMWSGDSKLSDELFLQRVQEEVTRLTHEKYDDRAVITPRAYRRAVDVSARKFMWHLDIEMAVDAGRTVQNLAIIAQDRRSANDAADAAVAA